MVLIGPQQLAIEGSFSLSGDWTQFKGILGGEASSLFSTQQSTSCFTFQGGCTTDLGRLAKVVRSGHLLGGSGCKCLLAIVLVNQQLGEGRLVLLALPASLSYMALSLFYD